MTAPSYPQVRATHHRVALDIGACKTAGGREIITPSPVLFLIGQTKESKLGAYWPLSTEQYIRVSGFIKDCWTGERQEVAARNRGHIELLKLGKCPHISNGCSPFRLPIYIYPHLPFSKKWNETDQSHQIHDPSPLQDLP